MDYLIAMVATPVLMVFWVLVQRWTADDPSQERVGKCFGCTCGTGDGSCGHGDHAETASAEERGMIPEHE